MILKWIVKKIIEAIEDVRGVGKVIDLRRDLDQANAAHGITIKQLEETQNALEQSNLQYWRLHDECKKREIVETKKHTRRMVRYPVKIVFSDLSSEECWNLSAYGKIHNIPRVSLYRLLYGKSRKPVGNIISIHQLNG